MAPGSMIWIRNEKRFMWPPEKCALQGLWRSGKLSEDSLAKAVGRANCVPTIMASQLAQLVYGLL